MSDLKIIQIPTTTHTSRRRGFGRWMVTFLGFPAGGFAAWLLLGPVDGLFVAVVGGLITGAVLGAVQSWGLGRNRPPTREWITVTAIGFTVGLSLGAFAVDYDTTISALAIQGAITGLCVGAAQASLLRQRLGPVALAWPAVLSAIWALGWVVTTAAGIGVEEQFTVFGASGAIVVAALTAILPVMINSRAASES
jgi:hypothetical protein